MASNPYQSPAIDSSSAEPDFSDIPPQKRGLVGHIRPLSILMILQGVLEALTGVCLVGLGIFLPIAMRADMQKNGAVPPGQSVSFFGFVLVVYVGMGVLNVLAGGLHIYAGCRNYQLRARTLGIVALSSGILTIFTVWCAPTGIALAVYGLVVLLNAETTIAFQMAEAGYSAEKVLAAFGDTPSDLQNADAEPSA